MYVCTTWYNLDLHCRDVESNQKYFYADRGFDIIGFTECENKLCEIFHWCV